MDVEMSAKLLNKGLRGKKLLHRHPAAQQHFPLIHTCIIFTQLFMQTTIKLTVQSLKN